MHESGVIGVQVVGSTSYVSGEAICRVMIGVWWIYEYSKSPTPVPHLSARCQPLESVVFPSLSPPKSKSF